VIRLKNHVLGQWVEGTGGFRQLFNPATEEVVAETSSEGVDFTAVLKFARETGGPALRAMSFEERAGLLRAMSRALYARREDLIEVARINGGNTRKDAKFDIDGATGTLAYYASLGRKLGSVKILWDGESDQLTGSARFHGRHAWLPLQGAAVHINAFNFPAWGTFEKAAATILAGMPLITKPATSSAWLAYEMIKILVEEDILPAGALQLIVGGTGDLLDQLGGQDVLAFTGSANTGALLRGGKGPVSASTRINVEADSLNAAVLGPDLEFGSDTYFAAQRNIVTEMTQKAGQKCTAIRRIFVPEGLIDSLQEAVSAELDRVVVGDPRAEGVTMGPLATASQLTDYREGVALLEQEAEIVYGSTAPIGDTGFMAGPVLLRAQNGDGTHVHSHEVFGPVATLIPYDGTAATAADLVARGGGSLACSVFSSDKAFLREILPELLTHNGRVLVVDEKVADTATGHGMVLPQMNHGGPGRAGGGSELGALRGLQFYMQRSAVQGNKALIERLLG
jgi:oxepin-CoA hydrolase/3-oxo-5,6-dehydrosuberyl-CoA semialdehyde dehydrogenase